MFDFIKDQSAESNGLTKIQNNSVLEDVVDQLRNGIIDGFFPPGDHLRVSEIAERLGVSRTPVREALLQLEQAGLIERFPNRGSFVKDFTAKDIKEIFGLRAALEGYAWQLAVEQIDEEDIKFLENLLEKQRVATEEGDNIKLVKLDSLFHKHLCQLAESQRLLKMWAEIDILRRTVNNRLFQASPSRAPLEVLSDHKRIIQAFQQRDIKRLLQLNQETNADVTERCIKALMANK